MNEGIAILKLEDSCAIIRRNHVATINFYVLRYLRGDIDEDEEPYELEDIVAGKFGGDACRNPFIPHI